MLAQVNSVLMQLPWNDWEIGPNEIEVLQREDGTDWKLGEGASGSVRSQRAAAVTPASSCLRGQGRQDGMCRGCQPGGGWELGVHDGRQGGCWGCWSGHVLGRPDAVPPLSQRLARRCSRPSAAGRWWR